QHTRWKYSNVRIVPLVVKKIHSPTRIPPASILPSIHPSIYLSIHRPSKVYTRSFSAGPLVHASTMSAFPSSFGDNGGAWREPLQVISDLHDPRKDPTAHSESDSEHSACACGSDASRARIYVYLAAGGIDYNGFGVALYGPFTHLDAEIAFGFLRFCIEMGLNFDTVCKGLAGNTLERTTATALRLRYAIDANPSRFALRELGDITRVAIQSRSARNRYHARPNRQRTTGRLPPVHAGASRPGADADLRPQSTPINPSPQEMIVMISTTGAEAK
ncbi:uncharacterized protein EV422DRAFT_597924, partial [Fimicolochytrium jonesii]|uniref:uncharacterized protein n=1 Tax=Fimicolochytrium jonesii TaxID=1396493 RepID=UPI0022FE1008